jgi:hypothetical protein
LGLIAQKERPGIAFADYAAKTLGEGEVAVLGTGDIQIADQFFGHEDNGVPCAVQGFVQASGEEAGFQAGGAEQRVLGESDALDGEQFLRVDGLVDGDEVVLEAGDCGPIGHPGGGEAMAAGGPGGTPGRTGLALGGWGLVERAALAGPWGTPAASCRAETGRLERGVLVDGIEETFRSVR